MQFIIRDKIFDDFSDFIAGVILINDADNKGEVPEIDELLRNIEKTQIDYFSGLASCGEHPNIASWRVAYKKFGSDYHQYRSSSEALIRRTLKGDQLRHINKFVDLYNYISLKYVLPAGGEDLSKMSGDLILDFANGNEPFVRLGGTENEPPDTGEVVYMDNAGVICRRWNWREADRTKLTEDTTNAIMVIEGLAPTSRAEIEQATSELADLVRKYCGGSVVFNILDNETRAINIPL